MSALVVIQIYTAVRQYTFVVELLRDLKMVRQTAVHIYFI